jgi:hypothetical protein
VRKIHELWGGACQQLHALQLRFVELSHVSLKIKSAQAMKEAAARLTASDAASLGRFKSTRGEAQGVVKR